jgi:hypothetical protein
MKFEMRVAVLVLAALGLVACANAVPSSSGTVSPTAAAATPTAVASTPNADQQLQAAVQSYSAAYLGGNGAAAYALLTARCQQSVGLSQMMSLTSAAASLYGALPITSLTVNSDSGSQATVTYTYAVAKLNQSQQPWVVEGGSWKDDHC